MKRNMSNMDRVIRVIAAAVFACLVCSADRQSARRGNHWCVQHG